MRIANSITSALWVLALTGAPAAQALDGDLDLSFGGTGKVRTSFDVGSGDADHAIGIALQPDGLLVEMGSVSIGSQTNVGLTRILPNGSKDLPFGSGTDGNSDGKVVFGSLIGITPRAVALQSDGRIVIAGKLDSGQAVLMRRATDGTQADFPGSSIGVLQFAIPNTTSTEFVALLGLPGGKLLAAGNVTTAQGGSDFFVARFNGDGTLDSGFGSQSGYTRVAFNHDIAGNDVAVGLALAGDGRIAVVGTVSEGDNELGIAMLTAGGVLDPDFDGDGRLVVSFDIGLLSDDRGGGACFAPNGNLFVGGTITSAFFGSSAGFALLSTTGALVDSFADHGRNDLGFGDDTLVAGVACAPDGKFLAIGTYDTTVSDLGPSEAFVVRFTANGSNDVSFAPSGVIGLGLNRSGVPPPTGRADRGVALALRPDGAIYAAFDAEFQDPDYDFAVARLTGGALFANGFE